MKKKRELNFDLKQLRSYLTVLQEKNFTRASRKLKRGQATISHHIQSLEDMLGVKLIERTSTDFSVTDDGKTFKAFCEKLFDDVAPRFKGINGGYTRIIKVKRRHGDNAPVSVIELSALEKAEKKKEKKSEKKKDKDKA